MNTAFFNAVRSSLFGGKLTQDQVDGINAVLTAWDRSGDKDDRKLAYLLATTKHETANTMQPIYERGQKSYFDKYEPGTKIGKALGNTNIGDGYLFRGRGYVQLTGRYNYRSAGMKMDYPLLDSPDKALDPVVAGMIMVRGSVEGWFTGKKLGDYISDAKSDYINARRVINGTDRAQLIANYAHAFEQAIAAGRKGVSVPPPPDYPQHPEAPVDPLPIDTPDNYEKPVSEPAKGIPAWVWIIGALAIVLALVFFTPIF